MFSVMESREREKNLLTVLKHQNTDSIFEKNSDIRGGMALPVVKRKKTNK